jgi:tetratricopeptide (TPR) repeat protein
MLGEAMAALAHAKMGNAEQAAAAANQAMTRATAAGDVQPDLLVDVSQALFVTGAVAAGEKVLLRAISLGEGDERFGKYMNRVMATFQETAGVADNLREDVKQRFIQINNEGVRLGKAGDFDQAIGLFREAAAQLPSLQMFANAAKAILAKLNRDGWNDELAAEAMEYLKRGKRKAAGDARIVSAIAAFGQVATKFGIRQSESAWD